MQKPRPFLTAACFVLFVAVFVATNRTPAVLSCPGSSGIAALETLQRLAGDVRHIMRAAVRPD